MYLKRPDLCVKVLKEPESASQRRRHNKEILYVKRISAHSPPYDFIAQWRRELIVAIFETVRNADGQISKSLEEILNDESLLSKNYNKILSALKEFYNKLYRSAVVSGNTNPSNLLLKESENGWLFVQIDDLGTTTFISLEYCFKFLAKLKIKRYWMRFIKYIEEKYKLPFSSKLAKDLKSHLKNRVHCSFSYA